MEVFGAGRNVNTRQHASTVCWRHTIIRITEYDRHPCTTVVTLGPSVCFAQSVLSQRPLLNSSKSESILIGTRQHLRTFPPVASPTIAGIPITFSDTIKTLGVTLDQHLTLNKHVSSLSRNIHFYTRALRHSRPAGPLKTREWQMQEWKMQEWKMRRQQGWKMQE